MKVALAQINTIVGDCEGNLGKVIAGLDRGREEGADLVVFPEATLPGYPAEDLLERADFLEELDATLARAVEASRGIAMVLGTVGRADAGEGNPIHNSAVLVDDGTIVGWQHKTLLPTYDVFDEGRYFRAAVDHPVFPFRGRKLALSICEDLWNDPLFWNERRYPIDPVERWVREGGADTIISLSASPFSVGRPVFRREMISNTCRHYGVDVLWCNLVGGNTSLVFDGNSLAVDSQGVAHCAGASFESSFTLVDLPSEAAQESTRVSLPEASEDSDADVRDAYQALVLGTRDYLEKSGFRSAVIGLSGGIDSALTAAVAVDALGADSVTGVAMPSRYSSEGSVLDARKLAKALGIRLHELSIEKTFSAALETLAPVFEGRPPDVAEENLQARARGMLLMGLSNKFGSLLLTTGNKSELAVGYCTLYGDMSGGLAVISDVPKTLVYRICRWLNRDSEVIPWNTIDKPPSAELRPDQKDEDSLPPYEVLDEILEEYIENRRSLEEIASAGHDRELVREVLRKVDVNEYKRKQAAPGLRITSKAFGHGRRYPIVKRVRR